MGLLPDDFDPRVKRWDPATGQHTYARKSDLHGLDEWADSWEPQREMPVGMTFNGWHGVDDRHPAGGGTAAYRIVFKTVRLWSPRDLEIKNENFRVIVTDGPVTFGEARFPNAIAARRPLSFLVPQYGHVERTEEVPRFVPTVDRNVEMSGHEETTPSMNFIEVIVRFPDNPSRDDYRTFLAQARTRVGPLLSALDLLCGERLIGPVITEEVGETFDDWHWNRWLGGKEVMYEAQARLKQLDTELLLESTRDFVRRYAASNDAVRGRLRTASQWYWNAEREIDQAQGFISYWLVIEALELKQNADIRPIKHRVATILGVEKREVGPAIGRLYGARNRLLHGESREVDSAAREAVRVLATTLLEHHLLGQPTEQSLEDLAAVLRVPGEGR